VLCFLGSLAIEEDGLLRQLDLRPKAVALLVRLALVEGQLEREELADLLFPHAADARGSLRWHLTYLRRRLPIPLTVDRRTIGLDVATDVAAFRAGTDRILMGPVDDAPAILALYRGDLCAGLTVTASADFDNWLYVEEDRLRRIFRRAAVAFAERELKAGRPERAIPSLRRLTEIDPYLEEAHVLLVRTCEAAGRETAARQAYDRYQRIVRTELHAEPRPEVVRRYESQASADATLPNDELVPLREISMHILEWPGREPPLIAIHGSAGHAYGLTALGEQLAPDVRFLAIDLRGHGFSDKPPTGYGLDDHVEDVLQLIATLRLRRPVLLGHSIGGAIATFIAAALGEACGGLILLDAVIGDRSFVASASFVVDEFGAALEHRFKAFDEYHSRWGIERAQSVWGRWLERSDRMELAPLPDGTFRKRALALALETEWASLARADALGKLASVLAPVLVIHAAAPWIDGPYLDEETVRSQFATARTAKLFVAEGSSHSDVIRRPSVALLEAIRDFVRDVRTGDAGDVSFAGPH
jgi:pimeloyl-ACP methyl ester carboxylesterase